MLHTDDDCNEHWLARGRCRIETDPAVTQGSPSGTEVLSLLCPDWRAATLVVDADLLIVAHANAGALEILGRRDPLAVNRGCLELKSAADLRRLQASMQDMLRRDLNRASIVVDDSTNGTSYALHLGQPKGSAREMLGRHVDGSARLIVVDVAVGNPVLSRNDLHELAIAFGLTFAELSILAMISQGRQLVEIARMRDVALHTVRNQCKCLLNKTRSRRQSDLVKLVVALCAQETTQAGDHGRPAQRAATAP